MDTLTARQTEILELIRALTEAQGYPPTRSEIARAMGFRSANAAEQHLRALARKGAIELLPGASRGLRIIERPGAEKAAGLAVVGRVAAGSPLLAEQNVEGHYRLDAGLFRPRADYLLRVRGMSMREAGILDGDLLAVHRTPEAANGQVVVARLGDEVTVKRLYRRGHEVRLLPENPELAPLVIDLRRESLVIEGIGVGLLRHGRPL